MLWTLALAPLLWWGYRALIRRQRRAAEQFAEPRLFGMVVSRPPGWQRSLPAACQLAALLLLAAGMARPVTALPHRVNRAAVVIAIDTSKSMIATDAQPTRLEAARRAALLLADLVPRTTALGLVSFSEYGTVLLPPGTDRRALADAIERLRPQSATSIGGGITEAVRVLAARAGSPGSIVIVSDGVSNFGPDPDQAAARARDEGVRIFAVGVGRPGGTVMRVEGQLVLVPADRAGLARIAQITGGQFFSAAGEEELRAIARMLNRDMGWEFSRQEATFLLVGAAGLLMLVGGGFSLRWFGRLP